MFKKTKIAAVSAAVLGLSSMTAQAVSVNEAGSSGEVLIFPYYNVNNGFVSLFNITNTTAAYKAVKVRFRESENSNDVLDFNIYLSPFDVFTMSLKESNAKGVLLTTADKSCTHPTIPAAGVLFRHTAYTSTSLADVREGYLEVIEMGEIPLGSIATGILHAQPSGVPADCGVINAAWVDGTFTEGGAAANTSAINQVLAKATGYPAQTNTVGWYGAARPATLTPPTGGIVGSSILVDTVNIAGYVAEPVAINNYSTIAQHYLSSDENFYLLPSLASGNVDTSERFGTAGVATYTVTARDWGLDDKDILPREGVPSGINPMPIADALLVTEISNQYFLSGGTLTDYVVNAPMRKHAIYNDYQYVSAGGTGYVATGVDIPVGGEIGDATAPNGFWDHLIAADDVSASVIYYNREEGSFAPPPGDFSPPVTTTLTLVPFFKEVNIISLVKELSSVDSVLGSDNATQLLVAGGFDDGWTSFTFSTTNYDLANARYTADWTAAPAVAGGTSGNHAHGVPLAGFMASRSPVGNGNVGETFPNFVIRDY